MKKAIGLATSEADATRAVEMLTDAGIDADNVLVLRSVGAFWRALGCTPVKIVATEFAMGTALGVATFAIFGAVAAAGELMQGFNDQIAIGVWIVFALLGVLVGGGLGLVLGIGDMEDESRAYVRGIRAGNRLVMVTVGDEQATPALNLLRAANLRAVHICTRGATAQMAPEHAT